MRTATLQEFLDKKIQKDVFVQIGTFDGDDIFRELVFKYNPKMVILVEPNKDMTPDIKYNYSGVSGVFIENVAITTQPQKEIVLYLPAVDENTKAQNGCYYSPSKFSLKPMNDWGNKEEMRKMYVRGITMTTLLRKYQIRHIDFLCLDTEGYDVEILKSMDLWKYWSDIIQYEKWGFDPTCFARHNADWDQLGEPAMDLIQGILSLMGYGLYTDQFNSNIIAVTNREAAWIQTETESNEESGNNM
jgi:FkbM family methyltransferase